MARSTVTKTWIAGVIVMAGGLLVGGISLGLMLAFGGHFVPAASGNGSDFVPRYDGYFWTTLSFTITGFIVAAVGGIVQLVAWIGAVVNTSRLQDKTWFAVLLAGGLLGFAFGLVGFAAMVAYVVAGPDGMAVQEPRMPTAVTRPPTLAPTA